MQDPTWQFAAEELRPTRLNIVALLDGSGIAPLELRLGHLESATVRRLWEPLDLLWHDEEALDRLAEGLRRLRLPLLLPRVPAASPSVAALRRAFARKALVIIRPGSPLPVLDLERDPEERLSASRRSALRRARRHAESLGQLTFDQLSPGPGDVEHVLEEALEVDARSWRARTGTALQHDHLRLPFYRRYACEMAASFRLRVAFLRIDGRPAAMQLAVEQADRLWLLKIAFDEAYAHCSPGHLLMMDSAQVARAKGLEAIELLGDAAPWTQLWSSRERPMVSASFLPVNLRGVSTVPLDFGVRFGRKLATWRS
jgi:hypothetical protein